MAAATVIAASVAQAATSYSHVGLFGGSGSGNGQFAAAAMPQRMAVHEASGKLFVADRGNNRVQAFTPSATGATFAFSVAVTAPVGVAIDQGTGNLYVSTTSQVLRFNPDDKLNPTSYTADGTYTGPVTGSAVGQVGAFQSGTTGYPLKGAIAVDPTDSSLLIADVGRNIIQRYNSSGAFVKSFNGCSPELFVGFCSATDRSAFTNLSSITVTSTGDIIAADITALNNARIDRFDRNGTFKANLSLNGVPVPNKYMTGASSNAVTLATNPETDEVFVSSSQSWSFESLPARIYQFEKDVLVDNFTAPTEFGGYVYGIAARGDDPGRLYVLAGSVVGSAVPRIQTYDAITPASVSFDGVSSIAATGATFSGQINPNGSSASWAFRYRLTGSTTWTQIPATPVSAGSGEAFAPVSQIVTGLDPNRNYEVRLVGFVGAGVESTTTPVTFQTKPAPPAVTSGAASFIEDKAARLYGNINPLSSNITYYFEWGGDTDYGNVTPDPALSLAAAPTGSIVKATMTDLEPGTEYHYRLIAENEFGQKTTGDDISFRTLAQARPGLPAPRAYEMTTRLPTGGMGMQPGAAQVSEDGSRGVYHTAETEPAPPGGEVPNRQFVVERGEDRWQISPIDLPDAISINPYGIATASRDLSHGVAETRVNLDPDDRNNDGTFEQANQRKGMDLYLVTPGAEPVWISRSTLVPKGEPQTDIGEVESPFSTSLSVDGQVVAFKSARRMVAEDTFSSGAPPRIYKWDHGTLGVASILPGGAVYSGLNLRVDSMSRDGSRMVWGYASDGNFTIGSKVYIQRDGLAPVAAGNGVFVAGTPTLSRIAVLDAGTLYSVDTDTGARQEISGGATVRTALRPSQDGRVIVFVSPTAVQAEQSPLGESPVQGRDNIYRAKLDGNGALERLKFIAAPAQGELESGVTNSNEDGSMFAFGSKTALTGQPVGTGRQLFVYDDVANSLTCVSCPASGAVPHASDVNADVNRASVDAIFSWYPFGDRLRRYFTRDGGVFFSTRTPLVAADQNQERDVYEYSGGELRLVSRGAWDDSASTFQGVGRDGVNAYFMTSAALDPRDDEPGVRKLYVARVGGGFPQPDAPQAPCVGDDCQGRPNTAPEAPALASTGTSDDGNADERRQIAASLTTAKAVAAIGGATSLHVRVSAAGRIKVRGDLVRRVSKRARKAGIYQIQVRLKGEPKRLLAAQGQLTTGVQVVFRSATGEASKWVRVTFKIPARGGAGRSGR